MQGAVSPEWCAHHVKVRCNAPPGAFSVRIVPTPYSPAGVVWLASYPKSGNTWARFLICNLLYGKQESAQDLARLLPDLHETGVARAPAEGLLKTHFPYSAELPNIARTIAAIYIVRDPADVLISNYFYAQRSTAVSAESSAAAFDEYVDAFIEHRGDPRWIERGMASWEVNVRSWFAEPKPFPILRLRYEDMSKDPRAACRRIAQLLGVGAAEPDIAAAARNSSFQRMREIERADIENKRQGIFYKPYLAPSIEAGRRFMRRGLPGDGRARLSAGQRARLHEALGPLLEELGYPPA